MRITVRGWIGAVSGTLLFVSAGGALIWGTDFMIFVLGERLLEYFGLLPPQWFADHMDWLVGASTVVTVPILGALAIWVLRRSLAVERELGERGV